MLQERRPRRLTGRYGFGVVLAVLALALPGGPAYGQAAAEKDFAPGLGVVYGQGNAEEGATLHRFGFTTRRLKDGGRIGSLALIVEGHTGGVPFDVLDAAIAPENVSLETQSLFGEIKRYFPVGGIFHYYWALRGGFTRINGTITDPGTGATVSDFKTEKIAPLGLFALPLALENPGFLLLAFVDGASFGLTVDVVPNRIWLDFQVGASLLPGYRDSQVVIDQPALLTNVVQLAVVF